jgi:DNA mismatch repair protein PMS2
MEESIVLDHLDIFKLNGFDIRPSLSDSPGKRCHLHAIPMSGNTVFTLSDLEELIHLIQSQPDKTSVRCSKARAMFAMRACRSSIMIGKALSEKMMEKVVRNLGGLDKPWSCPHGRPTMRHLTELEGLRSWNRDDFKVIDAQD